MSAAVVHESSRRELILEAARTIFSHYGFRRVSLEEIAREAGISRTGLYHHFRNKEEIFRALSENLQGQALAAAEAAAATAESFATRLLGVLEAKKGWLFALLHVSRHGIELTDENNRLCSDINAASNRRYHQLLTRLFREADGTGEISLAGADFTPDTAATFLVLCAEGLTGSLGAASSPAQYRRRLAQLVGLVVKGLGGELRP